MIERPTMPEWVMGELRAGSRPLRAPVRSGSRVRAASSLKDIEEKGT
jgi:hypothetical protein